MTEIKDDNKNPWRFHPLFIPYKKYHEGKNTRMGRWIGLIIALIIITFLVLVAVL